MLARALLIGLVLIGCVPPAMSALAPITGTAICVTPDRAALEAIKAAPGAVPVQEIRGALASRALDDFRTRLVNPDALLSREAPVDKLIWLATPDWRIAFLVVGFAGCTIEVLRIRPSPAGDPA